MNYHKGFIAPLFLIILAILLAGGVYVYTQTKSGTSQNIATSTAQSSSDQVSLLVVDPKTVAVGDIFGPWTVKTVEPIAYNSLGTPISGGVNFTGTVVFRGVIAYDDLLGEVIFVPVQEDVGKMPLANFKVVDRDFNLIATPGKLVNTYGEASPLLKSLSGKQVTIEVTNFYLPFGAGNQTEAQLLRIIQ